MIKLYKKMIVALTVKQFQTRREYERLLRCCPESFMYYVRCELAIAVRTLFIEILLHMIPKVKTEPTIIDLKDEP